MFGKFDVKLMTVLSSSIVAVVMFLLPIIKVCIPIYCKNIDAIYAIYHIMYILLTA